MGDRGNIYIRNTDECGVFLYTHWQGTVLGVLLREAVKRGRDRWTDVQYFARIVFCEMIRSDVLGLTGYGISANLHDNGYPILHVNCETCTVKVANFTYARQGQVDWQTLSWRDEISFARLIEMTDEEVQRWHLGAGFFEQ